MVSVAFAVPKGQRSTWAVEKLTELGVDEIIWLHCERSIVSTKSADSKLSRWQRVAHSAAAQSHRDDIPALLGPWTLMDLCSHPAPTKFFADPKGTAPPAAQKQTDALWMIGPEGGWSASEHDLALQNHFIFAKLAPTILRVETAAIAAASWSAAS